MDSAPFAAILAHGHALPDTVRGNDDPIFDWLSAHTPSGSDLFNGLKYRRVLASADGVVDILSQACQRTLHEARLQPAQVDLLIGAGSVSTYVAPNDLCLVHQRLGLGAQCRVLPLNSDYTTFLDGLRLAHDLVHAGTAQHVLVACGNNWTHHVDYHEPVSLAASDGAGAALVGRSTDRRHWRLVDWDNETQSNWYGAFRMAARPAGGVSAAASEDTVNAVASEALFTKPLMKLDDTTGQQAFKAFGLKVPGTVVNRLLAKHGLSGQDITLISHQSSKMVEDAWRAAIQPGHYISTLTELGDMVSSSVPVNLSRCHADIHTDHLVLLGIGMEMHATALLLARG